MHEEHFRTFRSEFLKRDRREPLSSCSTFPCGEFELRIGYLNSVNLAATSFTEYGYVGSGPLDDVLTAMAGGATPAIRILVLHHHLVPVGPVQLPGENGVSLTIDADEILRRAQEAGVQLFLHGHQHFPKIFKFAQGYPSGSDLRGLDGQDVYIVAGGSAGSSTLPSGLTNIYPVFEFDRDGVK
jgi:3',5'-cyclic AMP phosphodiesterase CpdA